MPSDRASHTVPLYIVNNVHSTEFRRLVCVMEPDPVTSLRIRLLASTWSRISRSPHRSKFHSRPSPLTIATTTNQARPKRARQQHHATRQFGTTTRTHGPTIQVRSVRKITTHFSKTLRLSSSLYHKDATQPTRRLSETNPARYSLKLGMKNYKPWSTQSSNCSSPRIGRQQEARRI